MKPIHLNLAARPYRDYRPVYAAVVAMSLLAAFLMLNNIETYYRYIHETQSTRAKIAELESQTAHERELAAAADQRLKGIDLARLDSQTRFINEKLAERAFSWSALLDQLEGVLADDVRLVSVSPAFQPDGQVRLTLMLQSKTSNGLETTINRMYQEPHFSHPFPTNQSKVDTGGYSFAMTVTYLPPGFTTKPAKPVKRAVQREVRR